MLALEAIYGDKLDIFDEKSVPRSFQVYRFSIFIIFLRKALLFLLVPDLQDTTITKKGDTHFFRLQFFADPCAL
jgi:hypothetical protein